MPQGVRRLARDAGHRVLGHERGPLVSVVVTVTDQDKQYLAESLLSVREQTHTTLDILIAPYGQASVVSDQILADLPDDYRLRLLESSATQAEARDRGGRAARGAYVCFLLAADLLTPNAMRTLVTSLERSGSDLAVGRIESRQRLSPPVVPVYDLVHAENRSGLTLADFPVALSDVGVSNRLFRTSFWRRNGFSFDVRGGAAAVGFDGYLKANRFDVVTAPVCVDMDRADGTPVEQLHDQTLGMAEWIDQTRSTWAAIGDLAPELRDHWALGELAGRAHTILGDVERMTEEQWTSLRDLVVELEHDVSPQVWLKLPVEARARLTYLLADQREELTAFVASRWFERGNLRTRLADGKVHGIFPDTDLPEAVTTLNVHETPARVLVRDVRPLDSDRVEVDLVARIELVDLAGRAPVITARLVPDVAVAGDVDEDGYATEVGETLPDPVELTVTARPDAQANMTIGHKYQDYRPGGCRTEIDLSLLAEGRWHLEVTVDVEGVVRTTSEVQIDTRGPAGNLATRYRPRVHTSSGLSVAYDRYLDQLSFRAAPTAPTALVKAHVVGRTVCLMLSGDLPRAVQATGGGVRIEEPVHDGKVTLTFPAHGAVEPGAPAAWRLEALHDDALGRIVWTDPTGSPWTGERGGSLLASRDGRGYVQVIEVPDTVALDRVELGDGQITVRGHWLSTIPKHARLTLSGSRHSETVKIDTGADDFEVVFSLHWDEWGLGESVLPSGVYQFKLTCGAKRPGNVRHTHAFLEHQAEFQTSDEVRLRPVNGSGPGITLQPPIPVDHAGSYAHNLARERVLAAEEPLDESAVYLSTYAGSTATDSQLAIHEHLRRTRPDLKLYWGVADHASRVPEGGIPVVLQTPEWYRVIGTAKYLVQNIDFDRWWRKREGQRFLQTFHGYPAKSMGLRMWRAKMFTELRCQAELDRTTAGWDLILTPTPEMDRYYREEYAYDGPIHSEGYPRDDALVSPTADEDRTRTRNLLGIGSHQKVVLYAPTWRDHLALNYRSAKMVEHLDVVAASDELGDDYVILVRGHRFNSKGSERSERTARVIDVTDYPEINDLILASDAAVLDYSSLRFDFALTGRPMVFLVPDLSDYTGGIRGFLYDYADTAPGPMLDTAEEVVAALSDLGRLESDYRDRIAEFNAKYQYTQDGKATERVVERFFDKP
ncbi:CDP-glycerol glycerophosphotransferase [Nocardioides luteus]|uniref:Glycosyl/glycerophosphate transferase teichoic acid biosynthesis n=1 Tax=Nocardioides luteus TaxID=1844 RepID=A0ABQ5SZQ8_9ACTN|nr:CDP-glycerol glycerophosphotransferase family protein [Nocardioides luteus]MDR7312704.1 CDP-glycerol glycerophosphotransferase [Nocardioides luteus]GGR46991.1 glycosyl/glycerophosphate transferase teichoic acid biosynthesis [Nocardioides luteus]GLJ68957.1 glycosyl/glycerophosphate transferase teichoic acid biosynthesis [Nocardioides luteus]